MKIIKIYTILPGRIWTRGRSNRLSYESKCSLVQELGITDVVQLATRPDEHWRAIGVTVHNCHMSDSKIIPDWIDDLAYELAEPGHNTLIMCQRGRNRSVFLAGLIFCIIRNCSGEITLEHLRIARPNCLSNEAFIKHLRSI